MLKHCRNTSKDMTSDECRRSPVVSPKRSTSVPPKVTDNPEKSCNNVLVTVRANVVYYDEKQRKWIPCGSQSAGISRLQILHNPISSHYKILANKIQDSEVTLDSQIVPGHRYNEATPSFHQWRDTNQVVYGFNFTSKTDANEFSKSMKFVLKILQARTQDSAQTPTVKRSPSTSLNTQQSTGSTAQLHVDVPTTCTTTLVKPNVGDKTKSSSNSELYLLRGASSQQFQSEPQGWNNSAAVQNSQQSQNNPSYEITNGNQSSEVNYNIKSLHTPSSPQPHAFRTPCLSPQEDLANQIQQQQTTNVDIHPDKVSLPSSPDGALGSKPPTPTTGSVPPPPPVPPPIPPSGIPVVKHSSTNDSNNTATSTLADAIQSAQLKKTTPKQLDVSNIPPPLVGAKAVLMEEMQRKLARRKAKADGEQVIGQAIRGSPFNGISRSSTSSPMLSVSNNRASARSTSPLAGSSIAEINEPLPSDMERLKQEILVEIRKDLYAVRNEILNALSLEPTNGTNM